MDQNILNEPSEVISISGNSGALQGVTKRLLLRDFIQEYLIDGIRQIAHMNPYFSFVLICNGIELLGICIDDNAKFDSEDRGLPKKHFNAAIAEYFPEKYQNYSLCENLRNGFAHHLTMSQKSNVLLSNGKSPRADGNLEPSHRQGMPILYIDDFFDDFKYACNEVIKQIECGKIQENKATKCFMEIASTRA